MTDRYPGYDVMSKRWSESWNEVTRQTIDRRLSVPREPHFFSPQEWPTLQAVCEHIMPQPHDREPVPLPAYVDQKLADGKLDGYRYAELPPQGEAWQRGLMALEKESIQAHGQPFHSLSATQQDEMLRSMQGGKLTHAAWGTMPCKLFFEHRVLPDIIHAYYAHPIAWSEIGFGGPASPRGYVRMGLNRRDPWEAAEASPGKEAISRRKNDRVG